MHLLGETLWYQDLLVNVVIFVVGWLIKSPIRGGRRSTDL